MLHDITVPIKKSSIDIQTSITRHNFPRKIIPGKYIIQAKKVGEKVCSKIKCFDNVKWHDRGSPSIIVTTNLEKASWLLNCIQKKLCPENAFVRSTLVRLNMNTLQPLYIFHCKVHCHKTGSTCPILARHICKKIVEEDKIKQNKVGNQE